MGSNKQAVAPTAGDTTNKKDWTPWYLLTLLFLIALVVVAVLALLVLRPNASDNLVIIGVFIGLIGTTTAPALIGLLQTAAARSEIATVHTLVNHGVAADKAQGEHLAYMRGQLAGAISEAKRAADAAETLINSTNAAQVLQMASTQPVFVPVPTAATVGEAEHLAAPAPEPAQPDAIKVVAPAVIEVIAPIEKTNPPKGKEKK